MPAPGKISPWSWVPTLYVAEGLPYALVMSVARSVCAKAGAAMAISAMALAARRKCMEISPDGWNANNSDSPDKHHSIKKDGPM